MAGSGLTAATISQLRDLTVDDLLRAREAAVDAGAPGLVASVDFHLAASTGSRFEAGGLAAGQRGSTVLAGWAAAAAGVGLDPDRSGPGRDR